jgi:tetratricopeptide (TPR) repeat protein
MSEPDGLRDEIPPDLNEEIVQAMELLHSGQLELEEEGSKQLLDLADRLAEEQLPAHALHCVKHLGDYLSDIGATEAAREAYYNMWFRCYRWEAPDWREKAADLLVAVSSPDPEYALELTRRPAPDPEAARTQFERGRQALQASDLETARESFRQAAALDRKHDAAPFCYGMALVCLNASRGKDENDVAALVRAAYALDAAVETKASFGTREPHRTDFYRDLANQCNAVWGGDGKGPRWDWASLCLALADEYLGDSDRAGDLLSRTLDRLSSKDPAQYCAINERALRRVRGLRLPPGGASTRRRNETRNFEIEPPSREWDCISSPGRFENGAVSAYVLREGYGYLTVLFVDPPHTVEELAIWAVARLDDDSASCEVLQSRRLSFGAAAAIDLTCRNTLDGTEFIHCFRLVAHGEWSYELHAWFTHIDESTAERLALAGFDTFHLLDEERAGKKPSLRRWETSDGTAAITVAHPSWQIHPPTPSLTPPALLELTYKLGNMMMRVYGQPWTKGFDLYKAWAIETFSGGDTAGLPLRSERPWPGLAGRAAVLEGSDSDFDYLLAIVWTGKMGYQFVATCHPIWASVFRGPCLEALNSFVRGLFPKAPALTLPPLPLPDFLRTDPAQAETVPEILPPESHAPDEGSGPKDVTVHRPQAWPGAEPLPDELRALFAEAIRVGDEGRADEAAELLAQVSDGLAAHSLYDDALRVYHMIGKILSDARRPAQAAQIYFEAWGSSPHWQDPQRKAQLADLMADIFPSAGETEYALELEHPRGVDRKAAQASFTRGTTAAQAGNMIEARDAFREAAAQDASHHAALFCYGMALVRLNSTGDLPMRSVGPPVQALLALNAAAEAKATSSTDDPTWADFCRLFAEKHRDEVWGTCDKQSDTEAPWLALGSIAEYLGDKAAARAHMERALSKARYGERCAIALRALRRLTSPSVPSPVQEQGIFELLPADLHLADEHTVPADLTAPHALEQDRTLSQLAPGQTAPGPVADGTGPQLDPAVPSQTPALKTEARPQAQPKSRPAPSAQVGDESGSVLRAISIGIAVGTVIAVGRSWTKGFGLSDVFVFWLVSACVTALVLGWDPEAYEAARAEFVLKPLEGSWQQGDDAKMVLIGIVMLIVRYAIQIGLVIAWCVIKFATIVGGRAIETVSSQIGAIKHRALAQRQRAIRNLRFALVLFALTPFVLWAGTAALHPVAGMPSSKTPETPVAQAPEAPHPQENAAPAAAQQAPGRASELMAGSSGMPQAESGSSSDGSSNPARAQAEVEEAKKYRDRGDLGNAYGHLVAAIHYDPGSVDAHTMYAWICWKLGDRKQAIEEFETVIRLAPGGTAAAEAEKALGSLRGSAPSRRPSAPVRTMPAPSPRPPLRPGPAPRPLAAGGAVGAPAGMARPTIGAGRTLPPAADTTSTTTAVQWSQNGHWYARVEVPQSRQVTWREAKALAERMGGYLATITSPAENDYIVTTLGAESVRYCWLGGYKNGSSRSSRGEGWAWLTAERWTFAKWAPGEPNGWGGPEQGLQFASNGPPGSWNDHPAVGQLMHGFIVEWNQRPK